MKAYQVKRKEYLSAPKWLPNGTKCQVDLPAIPLKNCLCPPSAFAHFGKPQPPSNDLSNFPKQRDYLWGCPHALWANIIFKFLRGSEESHRISNLILILVIFLNQTCYSTFEREQVYPSRRSILAAFIAMCELTFFLFFTLPLFVNYFSLKVSFMFPRSW